MPPTPRHRRVRLLTRIVLALALLFLSVGWRTSSSQPAKIWLTENLLLRSVPDEGITFYDITQPATPRSLGLLPLKDNIDLAVVGTTLYVDSASWLLVYDIASPAKPVRISALGEVFIYSSRNDEFTGACGCQALYGCAENSVNTASDGSGSQGGSLARFSITGDRLYCIDGASIVTLDISYRALPREISRVETNWVVETLFPLDTLLFVGGREGMTIYSIAGGDAPEYVGGYNHLSVCDPVVVEGNRAYVTLRGGGKCDGFVNQLDVLDITDIRNPKLVGSYTLGGPYGLTVRDSLVIVCDGREGLRTIDIRNVRAIREISRVSGLVPYDVILREDLLVVTAEDGYYLYDARDPGNLRQFSRIVP